MTKFLSASTALVALVLVGCSADVLVYDAFGERGGYHAGELDYAGRKGAIHTVIAGNPFGGDKAKFDAYVLSKMQGQNRGTPATFVPAAGPQTDPLYRTVVAFNMPKNIDADRMCREGAKLPADSGDGTVRMSIAFCVGDTSKSDASGIAYRVANLDDPKFTRLVRETTFVMIPDENQLEMDRNSGNTDNMLP